MMNTLVVRGNVFLFLAAIIWGTTFVAQRVGMDHIGPLTFNFTRFFLGALFLAPFALGAYREEQRSSTKLSVGKWLPLWGGGLVGLLLCIGINLQQIGLIYTTAGKAGFITGIYVILVPMIGALFGLKTGWGVWVGAPLGAVGLYLMSITESFSLSPGDGWIVACSFAWAGHILLVGWLSPKMNFFILAFVQAVVCAFLSFTGALIAEEIIFSSILNTWFPLIYSGVVTTGIGFTLQVAGQKYSSPAHAAIIMQLETVFAALSGWLILGEVMGPKSLVGAGLMLAGMLFAQLRVFRKETGP